MEEPINETAVERNGKQRIIDATMVHVNLPHFVKQIKEEEAWQKNDRNAITLLKTNFLRIVLIALHKGAMLKKHTVPQMLSVQVLEGKMQFITDVQTIELVAGDMIALYDGIAHTVVATEETVFLLTLTGTQKE
jgi:quercetin dioxygenase-like cupin family protein